MGIRIQGSLPTDWFVYGLGEVVEPILFKGDRHDQVNGHWWCELQHRDGGRLTKGQGPSPQFAYDAALKRVLDNE